MSDSKKIFPPEEINSAFERWFEHEGWQFFFEKGIKVACSIAWSNGAYLERATNPRIFEWKCSDCRGAGEVKITFPCHPRDVLEAAMNAHREVEIKRHCMCPAHYLSIEPK